ncbi:MAG: glycosyltransferase family 4 protein [Candidatus Obscuribacterales bacterium]|nr:glycosyltransferase family 4 protein [Candidatus Obscuribacterales bacterium]
MKLLIVMPLAKQQGGAELALLQLLGKSHEIQLNCTVVFLEDGPLVKQVQALGIQALVLETGRLRDLNKFVHTSKRIAEIARSEKADVIFSWMTKAHLYGGTAALITGIPAMWYQHCASTSCDPLTQLVLLLPTQSILACSQYQAALQSSFYPRYPVCTVYPGVDLSQAKEISTISAKAMRQKLGISEEGPIIGMVARLQQWKGVHVFIDAIPKVLEKYPTALFPIIGGEHYSEKEYLLFLQERIRALGIEAQTKILGFKKNPLEWMQAMDIVIHASKDEPFGMVVVEAMALGKPVIAGSHGGPQEIITPGIDGLLSAYGDCEKLAENILAYLNDPAFANKVANAARERADYFSLERYASDFRQAVEKVLRASPRSRSGA